MSLADIRAQREEQQFNEKLASIEEAYAGDAAFEQTFEAAVDMLAKEAGLDLSPIEKLDLAHDLACEHLNQVLAAEKTAEADESDEVKNARDWGRLCAQVAHEAGVTSEDVAKLASDEEQDLFGRVIAIAAAKRCQAE